MLGVGNVVVGVVIWSGGLVIKVMSGGVYSCLKQTDESTHHPSIHSFI